MTINEMFVKFLMVRFGMTFDESMLCYKEYLKFRDAARKGVKAVKK